MRIGPPPPEELDRFLKERSRAAAADATPAAPAAPVAAIDLAGLLNRHRRTGLNDPMGGVTASVSLKA